MGGVALEKPFNNTLCEISADLDEQPGVLRPPNVHRGGARCLWRWGLGGGERENIQHEHLSMLGGGDRNAFLAVVKKKRDLDEQAGVLRPPNVHRDCHERVSADRNRR